MDVLPPSASQGKEYGIFLGDREKYNNFTLVGPVTNICWGIGALENDNRTLN